MILRLITNHLNQSIYLTNGEQVLDYMQVAFVKVRIELITNHLDQSKYLANQEQVLNFASGFCQPEVGTIVPSKPKKNVEPKPFLLSLLSTKCFLFSFWVLLVIFIQNMLCNVPSETLLGGEPTHARSSRVFLSFFIACIFFITAEERMKASSSPDWRLSDLDKKIPGSSLFLGRNSKHPHTHTHTHTHTYTHKN